MQKKAKKLHHIVNSGNSKGCHRPREDYIDCLEWLFVELELYIIIEYIDCVCTCLHEFKIKMSQIKELCQCVNQCVDQCLAQGQDPSDLLMPPFSMNISVLPAAVKPITSKRL